MLQLRSALAGVAAVGLMSLATSANAAVIGSLGSPAPIFTSVAAQPFSIPLSISTFAEPSYAVTGIDMVLNFNVVAP